MKFHKQRANDSSKKTETVGVSNPIKTEVGHRNAHAKERMCGTYLLRRGLEGMTEQDRDLLFRKMQQTGLSPVI